jgi:hypothetical protein
MNLMLIFGFGRRKTRGILSLCPLSMPRRSGFFAKTRNGFGSLRVTVRIGASAWKTSIFPDSGSGSFVLPIKKEIRKAEGLAAGDRARVHLELAIEPF